MKISALSAIVLAAVGALSFSVGTFMLAGCQRPVPPVYDPPPPPGPTPTPPPGPTPPPVPAGVASWAAFSPVLLEYVNGAAVSIERLDSVLGARRGSRTDPVTAHFIVEYWVQNAAGTEKLNVFAHFPNANTTKVGPLNVR